MTTGNTSLLGLALPVSGELSGTWGDTVNDSITTLLDAAVAGTTTLSTDADVTLTSAPLVANQSRAAILLWTATGTATRTITAPAQSKVYGVINATGGSQSIKLVGAGPTTGITIVAGERCVAAWNGSDFVKLGTSAPDVSSVTGTLAVANGGTGQTSYTNGQLLIGNTSGNTLAKGTLTAGTGITVTNGAGSITLANSLPMTYPGAGVAVSTGSAWTTSLTAASANTASALVRRDASGNFSAGTITATLSGNADTVTNGVYTNGSYSDPSWITTLAGSKITGNISGNAANVTSTVAILNGGTGQTTKAASFNALSPITTAGDLILGDGSNSATRLAIGTNGQVLTSNGTTATWAALPAFSYPGAGITVSTGSGWGTSLTAPSGAIVGTSDSQTLTNKTLTSPTITGATFNDGYTEETVTANTGTTYTIDLANGTLQILTMTGNCTFTFPTAVAGKSFLLLLKQDGTGSRLATWPAAVKWPSGSAPTLTTTANRLDRLSFVSDGTNWYGISAGLNYTV